MATSLRCTECDTRLKLATSLAAGERVKCPKCGITFQASSSQNEPKRSPNSKGQPDNQDDRPRKTKKKKKIKAQKKGLAIGLAAGGVALLLGIVGLIAWLASGRHAGQNDVAAATATADTSPPPIQVETAKPQVETTKPPTTPPKPNSQSITSSNSTPANTEPPKDVMERARRATVYIRVSSGGAISNGSGFIVKSTVDSVYIVTNYQVFLPGAVLPPPESSTRQIKPPAKPPSNPAPPPAQHTHPPAPVHPLIPHPQNLPHTHIPGTTTQPIIPPNVSVTLNRGTTQEKTMTAEIVGIDEEADLAMLHIVGTSNLPPAIDLAEDATVKDSIPISIFGFPGDSKNAVPATGSVTHVYRDQSKDISDLLLNGELSPGHTGGPVVDTQGRLVGIAVSSVFGKNVDRAIPTVKLDQLFKGKMNSALVAQYKLQGTAIMSIGEAWFVDHNQKVRNPSPVHVSVNENKSKVNQFFVLALASDPLRKVNGMNLLYGVAPGTPIKQDGQGWAPLPNAQRFPLAVGKPSIGKQSFSGTLQLPGVTANQTYAFQFSYVNADGVTIYTEPHSIHFH